MYELCQLAKGEQSSFARDDLIDKLFLSVIKLNIHGIISDTQMRELEGAIRGIEQAQPQGMRLHHELARAGAYEQLTDPRRQSLLQTFLTTEKSMRELARETEGIQSQPGIRKNLYSSMQPVFPSLPPTIQEQFGGSAEQALKKVIADQIKTKAKGEKIKEGWEIEKPRMTGKTTGEAKARTNPSGGRGKSREFSDAHKQHLTDANLRRWEQYRKQKA